MQMDNHAAGSALAGIALQVMTVRSLVMKGILTPDEVTEIGEAALLQLEEMAEGHEFDHPANGIARSIIEGMIKKPTR